MIFLFIISYGLFYKKRNYATKRKTRENYIGHLSDNELVSTGNIGHYFDKDSFTKTF